MADPAQNRTSSRPTPTVEDYLGVIYILDRDGETVIGARLSEWLGVSPPTVTATLQRMVRDGWVTMNERKEVRFTDAGRRAAESLLRRHMLSELLLDRLVGVPWSRVHAEAHEMEHTLSRETVQRLLERLEDPQTCPHGNPFPGQEHLLRDWVPLTTVPAGATAVIRRVHEAAEEQPDLMRFLEAKGLLPGTIVQVEETIPFNQTISLLVEGQQLVLGLAVANQVFVEVTSPPLPPVG